MLKKIVLFLLVISGSVSLSLVSYASNLPIISGVGGNFSALDSNNKSMQLSDYKGKIVVIAFGYTNCADICPFTLGYLKSMYEKLSPNLQKRTQVLFVSIDPEYDIPAHLNAFMRHFNEDFIGITGTQEQINHIVSLFQAEAYALGDQAISTQDMRRVEHKKVADNKQDKAKLFTHSVTIYLLDKALQVRSLEYTGTPAEDFGKKIKGLADE